MSEDFSLDKIQNRNDICKTYMASNGVLIGISLALMKYLSISVFPVLCIASIMSAISIIVLVSSLSLSQKSIQNTEDQKVILELFGDIDFCEKFRKENGKCLSEVSLIRISENGILTSEIEEKIEMSKHLTYMSFGLFILGLIGELIVNA